MTGLRWVCLLFAGLGLLAGGCGLYADVDPPPETLPAELLDINPPAMSLAVGEQTSVTLKRPDGTRIPHDAIEWTSLNPDVATVDPEGNVRATGPGETQIEASWEGAVKRAEVDVEIQVESISILLPESLREREEPYAIARDTSVTFGAAVTGPNDADLSKLVDPTWTTADETIARLTQNTGTVTAVGRHGEETDITAEAHGKRDAVRVRVDIPVDDVLLGDDRRLVLGETACLQATPVDGDDRALADRPVEWSSDDSDVVAVEETGDRATQIRAVGPGSTTVTATSETASAGLEVTVVEWADAAAGRAFSCGLSTDGIGYCWGDNTHGKLGIESTDQPIQPVRLAPGPQRETLPPLAALEAGFHHTCARTADRGLFCWGHNEFGQVGVGSMATQFDHPKELSVEAPVQAISVGAAHSCLLTTDGEVRCWGSNSCGQLGSPRPPGSICRRTRFTPGANTPTAIDSNETFATVSSGIAHTCGLTTDGEILCWGRAVEGQLGNGAMNGVTPDPDGTSQVAYAQPQPLELMEPNVGPQTDRVPTPPFQDVAAAGFHTCAIDKAGDLWCWGDNSEFGQAGPYCEYDGDDPDPAEQCAKPSLVPFDAEPVALYRGGTSHMCLATAMGEAYCWGRGELGHLGDGNGGSGYGSETPVAVVYAESVDAEALRTISSGYDDNGHNCAVTDANTFVCWGYNVDGQLGNGRRGDNVDAASFKPAPISFAAACGD